MSSQVPFLQVCAEDLPLVLQRPDTFPLVMGILQQINQKNVVFVRCSESGLSALSMNEVKQENAVVEEQHLSLPSELCQEWSLKGVEELLTEPEELHLRQDFGQQVHDVGFSHLQICGLEEKPSITLQSWQLDGDRNDLQEAEIQVDEKLWIPPQLTRSLDKSLIFQENTSSEVDEKPNATGISSALLHKVDINEINVNHINDILISSQICPEDRSDLHGMQAIKMESEEREAQGPYDEQIDTLEEQTEKIDCPDLSQSVDKLSYLNTEHENESSLLAVKSPLENAQSSDLELSVSIEHGSWPMYNSSRNTNALLASAADFLELEQSKIGEDHTRVVPALSQPLAAESSICASISSEKGGLLAEDIQPGLVASKAEAYCSNLTLSLASSLPQYANLNRDEYTPAVQPFSMQEMDDDQCQRNHPLEWNHSRKKTGPQACRRFSMQDSMSVNTKRQLFFVTDEPGIKDKNCVQHLGKSDDCSFCFDAKGSQSMGSQHNKRESILGTNNHIRKYNCFLSEGICGQTVHSLTQTVDEEGSPENQEVQSQLSLSDQATESHSAMTVGSSEAETALQCVEPERQKKNLSQVASQFSQPQNKKMRGILPSGDEKGAFSKKKDTRCHRSDGKHWRCTRECVNGAYYCEYHLRKRRIGYNRRRNNEVNPEDLAAVKEDPLKSNKIPQ